MNFGMEARLDGSQHITVETQQVMAVHLHIYYFISALEFPLPTNLLTHTQTQIDSFELHIQIIKCSPKEKKKKRLVYFIEFRGQDLMQKGKKMQMTNRK